MLRLEPGTLWPRVVDRTRAALRCGALEPIETTSERVEDCGVRFILRVVSSLARKRADRDAASRDAAPANPFLPFDPAMLVAEISDTHVCLLNRYNVIGHHILFVTRHFEDQELALTREDFEAALAGLREIDGLVFYNGGRVAGASQPHRHLQLVSTPLAPDDDGLPVDGLVRDSLARGHTAALPFRHAAMRLPGDWLDDPGAAAAAMRDGYLRLLATTSLTDGTQVDSPHRLPAYNLLVTRAWMLVVPRSREHWRGISINALGFAGSLFFRDRDGLEAVKTRGPMNVLADVGLAPV